MGGIRCVNDIAIMEQDSKFNAKYVLNKMGGMQAQFKFCNESQIEYLLHRSPLVPLPSLVATVCNFWDVFVLIVIPA